MNLDAAMRLAVEHADRVKGSTYPNPPVGAVILDRDGDIAGVGATEPPGGPHAEVVALRRAGERAAGGTAVVTLEPCNHHGRTPPCVDALVASRVSRVAYAVADPNPQAAGGASRLAESGVKLEAGVLADAVAGGPLREWLHKQRTGLPHVTWKFATSVDGRSAAADGSSQWITSEAARADVHRRRAAADAIVVGTGTVFVDDPALMAWARSAVDSAEIAVSVCNGAFVLGALGVLDGKTVTTHFGAVPRLKSSFPKATVQQGRRFVDNGKIVTTAGVSAGIDGALHVVARLLGRGAADETARYMEYRWAPEPYLAETYANSK